MRNQNQSDKAQVVIDSALEYILVAALVTVLSGGFASGLSGVVSKVLVAVSTHLHQLIA